MITIEFIIRSSIILGAGLAIAHVMRNRPAALRHWVLAGAVLLAALQPLMSAVLPPINFERVERVLLDSQNVFEIAAPLPDHALTDRVDVTPKAVDWALIAYGVWIGGVAASGLVLAVGVLWLLWLGWRGTPAGAAWQHAADETRARLGVSSRVRLVVTHHPALLVTWGAIMPVILLPTDADAWPEDRIRHVVAHEMAHLLRRDWLVQLLTETARAINWFNPLFWVACARLKRDSEHACDDIVLDLGFRNTSYAAHLLDLARRFSVHGRTWLPAPSVARPSTLERRVRAMLNPQVDRRPISSLRRAAVAIALLLLTLPIAAASQSGVPSGTVTDPMGRPLADAVIRLVPAADGGAPIDTRSDANGTFQFGTVPAGDYMLSVRSPGFSSKRHRVQLNGGGVTFQLQVQVGTLRETVTVVGGGTPEPSGAPRSVQSAAAPQAPTCTSTAGGQITPPRKIRDVRPRYKQEWSGAALDGSVLMQATIGKDGKVRGLDVLSPSNAELEDEALGAVSLWEFTPTYLNCEPVEVQMFVTVTFRHGA